MTSERKPRRDATRSVVVAASFLVSGITSYLTLVVAKRSLDADQFGQFALFWSLGFFAATVGAAPNEQELARSLAVRLERGESGHREVRSAVRAMFLSFVLVVALGALGYGSGVLGVATAGIVGVFALLVFGESVGALVRAEMAASRDTVGLLAVVAGPAIVRVAGVVVVSLTVPGLWATCCAVALSALVPIGLIPRVRKRLAARRRQVDDTSRSDASIFSISGAWKLAVATPPRALFAIGTPVLASIVATDAEQAEVGDVLAALSLTSAPVLVAAALQIVLVPKFATMVEGRSARALRADTWLIVIVVLIGTAVATALSALIGVEALELLFGETPGITATTITMMTSGAGMLFLANLLVPVCIATGRYSVITTAWTCGACGLTATSFLPGDVGSSIGRAVVLGATTVGGVLLWGIRGVLAPPRTSAFSSSVAPLERAPHSTGST